ncbi:hypothetical protein [Fusibacter tunisiensis]|uniref:Uncharacterized protein n=1 Tax=Fusibacter tunisiensis TaxID=1008308 RepID=A0ABS2MRF0_9FIRM|nr:hypothetical protein [Fusibacter tunisiensis]MBM7561982.1 hypothetical protein [Fusibacter tunisiensis]
MCPRKISAFFYMLISIFYSAIMFASHYRFSHFAVVILILIPTTATVIETIVFSKEDWTQDCTPTTERSFEHFYSVIGGAFITYSLAYIGFSPLMASAITGLLGAKFLKKDAVAVFTGTFVGMSSIHVFGFSDLLMAAIISGLLYVYGKEAFQGIGGKLGTTAFLGVTFTALVSNLESFHFIGAGIDITHMVYTPFMLIPTVLSGAFGALATDYLSRRLHHNTVIASSLIALLSEWILILILPNYAALLSLSIYCGTFVGMGSKTHLPTWHYYAFAGGLSGFLFFQSLPIFIGFGGKLGISAFVATLTVKFLLTSFKLKPIDL